jgi:hypothetical protein
MIEIRLAVPDKLTLVLQAERANLGLDHCLGHMPPTDTELWAMPTLVCPAWAKTCNLKRGCRKE